MSNTTNEYRFGGIYNIWKLVIERNLNVIRDTTLGSNYFPCQHVRFYFLTFTVNKNTNKIEAPADSCVAQTKTLVMSVGPWIDTRCTKIKSSEPRPELQNKVRQWSRHPQGDSAEAKIKAWVHWWMLGDILINMGVRGRTQSIHARKILRKI